jgi:hypothetical protein
MRISNVITWNYLQFISYQLIHPFSEGAVVILRPKRIRLLHDCLQCPLTLISHAIFNVMPPDMPFCLVLYLSSFYKAVSEVLYKVFMCIHSFNKNFYWDPSGLTNNSNMRKCAMQLNNYLIRNYTFCSYMGKIHGLQTSSYNRALEADVLYSCRKCVCACVPLL